MPVDADLTPTSLRSTISGFDLVRAKRWSLVTLSDASGRLGMPVMAPAMARTRVLPSLILIARGGYLQ